MHLGNMFLFEIQGMQKSRTYEKFNFKHYHETKIPPVIGFQSNYKMQNAAKCRSQAEPRNPKNTIAAPPRNSRPI